MQVQKNYQELINTYESEFYLLGASLYICYF